MEKPISMLYADTKQELMTEVRKVIGRNQLPFFLATALLNEICLEYQKEAMNELSYDTQSYVNSTKEEKEGEQNG